MFVLQLATSRFKSLTHLNHDLLRWHASARQLKPLPSRIRTCVKARQRRVENSDAVSAILFHQPLKVRTSKLATDGSHAPPLLGLKRGSWRSVPHQAVDPGPVLS